MLLKRLKDTPNGYKRFSMKCPKCNKRVYLRSTSRYDPDIERWVSLYDYWCCYVSGVWTEQDLSVLSDLSIDIWHVIT